MSKFKSGRFERALGVGASLTKAAAHFGLSKVAEKSGPALAQARRIKAATELVRSMGELKGALMKLGQMLSVTDDLVLPPEISALFRSLQKDSKRMSEDQLEAMFFQEFSKKSDELFRSFGNHAIAAASIGQVHQASLPTGEVVAVKIQYPDIEKAIAADFKNLDKLHDFVSLLVPGKPDVEGLLLELREALIKECDYLQEAQSMKRFREDYEGIFPNVKIPKVYGEFSTRHILTTEFVYGSSFEDALEFSQSERNEICQALYDTHMFGLYEKRLLHTDPQNGNYLFRPGEVILLDFGSTREFSEDFIRSYVRLLYAVEVDDYESYEHYGLALGLFMTSDNHELKEKHFEMIKKLYLPYTREGHFPVPEHNPFELLKDFVGGVSIKGRKGPRPEFLLLDRANLGFYTKIRKLGGVIDWTTSRDKYRAKWLND